MPFNFGGGQYNSQSSTPGSMTPSPLGQHPLLFRQDVAQSPPLFSPVDPPVNYLQLPIEDLMGNPNVRTMFKEYTDAMARVSRVVEDKDKLLKKIEVLQDEIHRLRMEGPVAQPYQTSHPVLAPSVPASAANPLSAFRVPQPAVRPDYYHEDILWTFEDAKSARGVTSISNPSRPNLSRCMRHPQTAEVITEGQYKAICSIVKRIVAKNLSKLDEPEEPAAKAMSKTKAYYQRYFPREYDAVLQQLEVEEPLVALCAASWKADHLVGQHLQSIADTDARNEKKSDTANGNRGGKRHGKRSRDLDVEEDNEDSEEPERVLKRQKEQRRSKPTTKHLSVAAPKPAAAPPINVQLATLGTSSNDSATRSKVQNVSAGAGAVVDVSFINVDKKISSLKDEFAEHHASIANAQDLLCAMEASPGFGTGSPTADMVALVARIDSADPNSPDVSEDDSNQSWGHKQFTAGSLTLSSVLTSWTAVGNCDTACQLLAASVKTCKVARHLCFERNIPDGGYMSDIYLEKVVSILWELWRGAGAPFLKGKESTSRTQGPVSTADRADPPHPEERSNTNSGTRKEDVKKMLDALVKNDLKSWTKKHTISVTSAKKVPTKGELIAAILLSPICFTDNGFDELAALVPNKKPK